MSINIWGIKVVPCVGAKVFG